MTTAERFRSAVSHPAARELSIAGVPWPAYKVFALLVGLLVFGVVGIATADPAPAVLAAAAAATAMWLGLGVNRHRH